VKADISATIEEVLVKASKILKIPRRDIFSYKIIKKSLDARKKPHYVYTIALDCSLEGDYIEPSFELPKLNTSKRVAVIGYGPAGIFASLYLNRAGFDVTVFEQGECIEDRKKSVDKFIKTGKLNKTSNIQFGEGGAGTFSDGKLTSRSKNILGYEVLKTLVKYGANEEILYISNPHLGTDNIQRIVTSIRQDSINNGVNINFRSLLSNIEINDNIEITVNENMYEFDYLVLAIGHSSRSTFRMLEGKLQMESKPFAVGFRIEHKQDFINKAQYGEYNLGAAEYKLTHKSSDRGIYSFCMCPGGVVVPAQTEEDTIVVNGMSYYSRDLENSNSAIVASIGPKDYGNDLFSGMEFQEKIEKVAYSLTGSYRAPVQMTKDFINGVKSTEIGSIKPTYPLGYELCDLSKIYPDYINDSIVEALKSFDRKIKMFSTGESILTGVETRTSSPIRITRNKDTFETSIENIYAIGEGSGYAGGIVSSAIDGIRIAERIVMKEAK